MPTYIMLSTLTPEGVQTVKNNPRASARSTRRSSSSAPRSRRSGRRSATSTSSTSSRRPTRRRWRASRSSSARAARPLRDADRDPDRRLHRLPLSTFAPEGPRRRRAAAASTRSCARCAARRSGRSCSCAPGNAGHRARRRGRCSTPTPTTSTALVAPRRDAGVDLVVVGPEAPLVAGLADALRRRRASRASGPTRRGRAARGLEGVRQGDHGGRRRADRRRTRSSHDRRGRAGGDRPATRR